MSLAIWSERNSVSNETPSARHAGPLRRRAEAWSKLRARGRGEQQQGYADVFHGRPTCPGHLMEQCSPFLARREVGRAQVRTLHRILASSGLDRLCPHHEVLCRVMNTLRRLASLTFVCGVAL